MSKVSEEDRCPLFSAAWGCQCEKKRGHKGMCVNEGDGFYGSTPDEIEKLLTSNSNKERKR